MRTQALALAAALAGWLVVACSRPAPSVESGSRTPPSVSVAGAPATAPAPPARSSPAAPPAAPKPVHRVHGDIEGRFVPAGSTFAVAEPIVVTFEARPTAGPLRVFVGGDGRNSAAFPTRVAVKAVDVATGATVCDNVASPPFPSFGGAGSEQVLGKGEWLRETFVLNPACPGLARPGVHRLTLHRRITDLGLKVSKPGAKYPTSCDVHPLHEGPAVVSGEPACEPLLDAVPWVTSVFELTITPFDAHALRRTVEARLQGTPDEMTRHRIGRWLCGWVGCACASKPSVSDAELLAALPSALPSSFPGACP